LSSLKFISIKLNQKKMQFKLLNLLGLNTFLFSWALAQSDSNFAPAPKKIEKITILRQNIFDSTLPQYKKFPYSWANKFHILTKEKVIQRELLFAAGDSYNQELIEESERNLRRYGFLGKVEIKAKENSKKNWEVTVETEDLWSLSLAAAISGAGDKYNYALSLNDHNFLGWGQAVSVFYSQDHSTFFKEEYGLQFFDPRVFHSQHRVNLTVNKLSFGHWRVLDFRKPFYALATKWSYGISAEDLKDKVSFFQKGTEVLRNSYVHQKGEVFLARSFGYLKRKELGLAYFYQRDRFRPVEINSSLDTSTFSVTAETEKIGRLSLSFGLGEVQYAQETRLDNFERIEDLQLGWFAKAGVGKSLHLLGSEREDWYFSSYFRWGWKISSRQYLVLLNSNEAYWYKQNFEQVKNNWRVTYFNKSLPSQTIALGLNLSGISRQLKYRQITLGGDLGLRGYEINEFSGQKQILLNLEDRIFTPLKILTVALGAVVFFDAGYLWEKESHINLKDLRTDVGLGLRLGFTKALAGRVARIDLAKALHEDRYFISLGVGQVFGWE